MKNKTLLVALIVITLSTLINFSQATLYQGNPAFNLTQSTYAPNQTIEGFLNFSLLNEPADNIIKATISKTGFNSIIKEISILDFLTNSSVTFACSQDCLTKYSTTGSPLNVIDEPIGVEEKYYGLVVTGMNPEVLNLTFKISGNNINGDHVCGESPIKMDLLNDGTIDYEFAQPSEDEWCSDLRSSNCFSSPAMETELETTPFCEKIFINKTGKVEVAARLKFDSEEGEKSAGDRDIEFYIYDENGNKKGNCSVDYFDYEDYNLASCEMSSYIDEEPTGFYIPEAKDYFVCIGLSLQASATYYIQKESDSPICGIYGTPSPDKEYAEDYEIYLKEAKFSPFDDESIFNEKTKIGETNLLDYVNAYIKTRYNENCTNKCVIPLKFISKVSQDITLSDLELKYQSPGHSSTTVYSFYNLLVNQPKINLTKQAIPLTAININAPEEIAQNYRIGIQYNSISLGSILFKVEPVPTIQSLFPLTAVPGQSTTFTVIAIPSSEGGQIMNYTWNFGDGSEEVTTIPRVNHIYSSGTYTLLIKATDSLGKIGTKIFQISTALSKEGLDASYLKKKQLFSGLSALSLESWYSNLIYNSSQINESLFLIQNQLNSANPDLNSIKSSLDSLKIPVSVSTSLNVPESQYIPDIQKINLDYLSDLGAGTYTDSEAVKNAVGLWQEDVSFSLGLTVKKITFDDNSEQEISVFTLRANSQDDIYSVFELPSSISPNQVKIKENIEPYAGFNNALGFNSPGTFLVTLAIPLKTEVSSINFYSSPVYSSLSLDNGDNGNNGTGGSSSILLPIIVGILVIIIVIVILVLIWKNKGKSSSPENSNSDSFENPADEYNIVSYIQSSLLQGKSKPEIEQELLSQGWTKKQIDKGFKNKDNQGIEPEPAFNY